MTVVKLMGGLGNQLFQYAYGRYLERSQKVFYNIDWFKNCRKRDKYILPDLIFKKIPLTTSSPTAKGYWQDLKYTDPIRNDLIKDMQKVKERDVLAIHIRRGDYLDIGKYVHLGLEYYNGAYNVITQMIGDKDVYVFSDDLDWCRDKFDYPRMTFVDLPAVESFNLMRGCKHMIIANSTFSWWAAYLSGGLTVAPDKWFMEKKFNIIPSGWMKVKV